MKHGDLDDDGRCVLSGLKVEDCSGCRKDSQSNNIPSATWPVKPLKLLWNQELS